MSSKLNNYYYDSIAPGYDELHGTEQLEKIKIVQEFLSTDPELFFNSDLVLLDVGCGTGTGLSTLSLPISRVGLEPASKLIKQANQKRLKRSAELNEFEGSEELKQVGPNNARDFQKPVKHETINSGSEMHLGYLQGIAEAMPIKNKACYIVISITAVHNFFELRQGILEIRRVAKERVIISVLKKAKRIEEIVEIIKDNFKILKVSENMHDRFFYLKPL